ncbi:Glycosyl hydrolases family 31 [Aspergillus sclerotialis]|uniref:Glycosyl hydrolases family 31 n=1 Tax=Aspergillus sclerotialis TaxID=2070753 RepID=A0A3A2ZVN8_9EURO|nr:Glycosyl hydrolases family 31 [Aspergillus sclerotialis]
MLSLLCLRILALLVVCDVATARETWKLGDRFDLVWKSDESHLSILQQGNPIFASVPGDSFLSASAGKDSVVGSSGNFNITNVDQRRCQSQNVTDINYSRRSDSINVREVALKGFLLRCGEEDLEYTMSFWVPYGFPDRVAFDVAVEPGHDNEAGMERVYLKFASHASEDFYGLGAQGSFASMKNQSIPIFSREQGVGRGDEPVTSVEDSQGFFSGGNHFTTYTAIPQFISTAGKVFYLRDSDTAYAVFNFTEHSAVTVRYDALTIGGQFMQALNMLEGITMLTDYTGRMPTLPEWVDHGAILGIQGGQSKVNRIVNEGLQQDCPIAGVWLQDWSGTHIQPAPYGNMNISRLWWNWEPDTELYPNWADFVQSLRETHNIRTLSYINTFLANVSTKADGYNRNLYLEATEGRYMIQNSTTNSTAIVSSGEGIQAGILDLSNERAREWFADILLEQVWGGANVSGCMWDFGEYTPVTPDTSFAGVSSTPLFYHNQYPLDWAIFQRSVARQTSLFHEMVTFHRSASFTANRHMNLFWAGDQTTTWAVNDGIKSAVTIMGQMGMSGYAHSHSDIGGYTTAFLPPKDKNSSGAIQRSAELLGRWGELAAVSSAVFRSHEGNVPEANAQFYTNSSTYGYFAYNARLFKSLGPYRRHILETECRNLGWPLLRMPVLYHPLDEQARRISYQSFYLGPHLYVAPVLDPATSSLDVYLPGTSNRTYSHVWSGVTYTGGETVTVAAPCGKPAIFIVDGAQSRELDAFLNFVRKENSTSLEL